MEIKKEKLDGKVVIRLFGRLDTASAPVLQDNLMPEFSSKAQVELDFGEVSYVSSAGLRVILMASKAAKSNSGKFTLINVSDDVNEILQMTGFADILEIKP